jgi:hypothetical protein
MYAVIESNVGMITFPVTHRGLQEQSDVMSKKRDNHLEFYGCVGAIMTMLFAFGSQKETECMSPHQN